MTDKLNGIKPGDDVDVSFRATVSALEDDGIVFARQNVVSDRLWFGPRAMSSDHFQITHIEPELAVGDMVTWDNGREALEVVAIKGDRAVLWNESSKGSFSDYLCTLTRVPAK